MKPVSNGRFCFDCKKAVTDFSKTSSAEWSVFTSIINKEGLCGNFYAHQLNRPFNNWRDKIILLYQTATGLLAQRKISRRLVLFLMTCLLILTGCYRQVRGRMKIDSCSHNNNKHKTSQTALPPIN